MSATYCDIIPQAGGWTYVFEGRHSAVYPSYRLAVEAARICSEQQSGSRRTFILRQQDLRGRMHEVQGPSDIWSPGGRPSLSPASGVSQA